jgi:protein-S-isoprenylcysteine O-methyltransferase Ste14
MLRWMAFLAGTAVLAYLSRGALRRPRSHGFPRFFAFVAILALVLRNLPVWELEPFSARQLVSWALLLASIALVLPALKLLRGQGRPVADRGDAALFGFEKTTALVTAGLYRHIRHPMYASLLCLAWGAFLKDPGLDESALLVGGASVCLLFTALRDETECLAYFGPAYRDYMATSKRFVPFVF